MSASGTAGRRRPFQLGLQAKMLFFSLSCVVVPLLVMGVFLLGRSERLLTEKIRETLANHLFRETSRLDGWLEERLRDTRSWSTSFVVVESLTAASGPGESALKARQDLDDYLISVLSHHESYESLFAVDSQGRVVDGERAGELEDWEQGFVELAATGASAAFSPLRHSAARGRATLLLVQPVHDRFNTTAGALVARVALEHLEELLAAPTDESGLGFWLLDGGGGILARAGRVEATPGREYLSDVVTEQALPATLQEKDLPPLGPSVFAARPLEGPLPGYVLAALSRDEAYRPLQESRRRLIGGGLAAILAIFFLSVVAARNLLGPILRLSEGARRVAAGDLEIDLPASGSDEIAELTRSFNEMTHRVSEGRQSLERTSAELARANASLVDANRGLETLAITDALTDLYNRRHFEETFRRELRRSARAHGPLALLLLDLDRFKQYNDRFGHAEGDSALRRVARALIASIRGSDLAFRIGGEEMAVLLPACGKPQALGVAEKLRAAIAATAPEPGERGGPMTVSIGVAAFPEDGDEPDVLAYRADMALYAAKARGRDRVVAVDPAVAPAGRNANAAAVTDELPADTGEAAGSGTVAGKTTSPRPRRPRE